MYNMQAIVRKSINNSTFQFEKLGYIANNLSNFNTVGFKGVHFEQYLREDGYVDGALRTNIAHGSIKTSKNPYDIAIDGAGYIPVVSPEGEVQYTRDGALTKGENGYLMTVDGWMVGDGIQIPANSSKFEIRPNGDVINYDTLGSLPEKIGTIPLVQFDCPEALEKGHNNKMTFNNESGVPKIVSNAGQIKQYAKENSNINIYDELNDLMRLNASMLASMGMMKVADSMYSKAINLRE